ncbi:biotin transporter BioY [Amphibacillus sediminis]|uniref:biotin transporter BioY n=1 Tax=Amphibacillus sediminis TaxID=360185 RepID=UPI000837515B|nr:biotin transporter BioY [Amphibacillus sediminis]
MKKLTALDLSYGAIFIGLMAIGANITVWLPFLAIPIAGVSVPLSMQTFFSILAGLLLGKRLASWTMTSYLIIGLIGVPVYANMQSGPAPFFGYTGGFLFSFIVVAFVTGALIENISKITLGHSITVALTGVLINYLIGVTYMYISMNTWLGLEVSYGAAWLSMFPFLIKDLGFAVIAGTALLKISSHLPSLHQRAS